MNARNVNLLAALSFGLAFIPPAHAVGGCSNALLNGSFGMQFSGMSAPAVATGVGGVAVPARLAAQASAAADAQSATASTAGAARLYLDPDGNVTGYASVNLRGEWLQGNVTGTYTVNPDCSVALALTDSAGGTENFSGVVTGEGDSVFILQTDRGTGVSGVLRRTRGFCQTSDLAGTFALRYAGNTVGASSSPYSSVGILSLDGQGNAAAAESRYGGGSSTQVASSGTITVNSDCSATLTLSTAGGSMNFLGLIGADEKQLLLVQSDGGTAATGSIVMQ